MGVFGSTMNALGGVWDNIMTSNMEIAQSIAAKNYKAYAKTFVKGVGDAIDKTDENTMKAFNILKNNPQAAFTSKENYDLVFNKMGKEFFDDDVAKLYEGSLGKRGKLSRFDPKTAEELIKQDNLKAANYFDTHAQMPSDQWADLSFADKARFSGDLADAYFFGDAAHGKGTRMMAGIGGVSAAGRVVSGGGITHTASGEQDIIGVPFI